MELRYKAVLITGTSHVGKTTLATRLADAMGGTAISTDGLARHPGRPWTDIPKPVVDFYQLLPAETIYWFLRVHHENMWPALRRMIDDHVCAGSNFVLEGSALRPEYVAPLLCDEIAGICLHAPDAFLRTRMQREAGYLQAGDADRSVMDKFIERSLRDNAEIYDSARRHGLVLVDVSETNSTEKLYQGLIENLRADSGGSQ
jgi:2-phosphoglycerate kinase